jgi:hypothetical protein
VPVVLVDLSQEQARGYCKSLLSKMKIQARLKNPW